MKSWKKLLFATTLICGYSASAMAWNTGAMYIEALQFRDDGTIRFTLLDPDPDVYEFECDPSLARPVWFEIPACDIGQGKGNKSASPSCLANQSRMGDMLLQAKLFSVPVHVQRDLCRVSEVALKPMPL